MKSSIRVTRGGRSISFSGPIANDVFKAMTAPKPATKFRSVAKWPEGVGINLGNIQNESHDTHTTREFAEAICRRLEREGFGGDGKIFPLSTRVEEVPA